MRGWTAICHANGHQKEARVAVLRTDKPDFKQKTVTREEQGHRHQHLLIPELLILCEVWRTIYHANRLQKKAGEGNPCIRQIRFKPKTIIRDEE